MRIVLDTNVLVSGIFWTGNEAKVIESCKKGKYDEKPFKMLCEKLNVKPDEVMMVGDNLKRDIETPKKFGMKTVLAKYGMQKQLSKDMENVKPDYVIKDISGLLECLIRENL